MPRYQKGLLFWDELTPKQKFELDYLDIDPNKTNVVSGKNVVCEKHFEINCKICKK